MDRKTVNKRIAELKGKQTPEMPKTNNLKLADAVIKAKKYDELIKQLKKDRETLVTDMKSYKEQSKPWKFGYVNGYIDGKISVYEFMNISYGRYLEDE